jgi:aminoglycoside phosphotransferase (APT) family kinase protein
LDHSQLLAALNALAPAFGEGFGAVTDLRRLSGGASQETWLFRFQDGTADRDMILRRRPDGLAERDERTVTLETEAALIRHVAARGAPVPGVVHVCIPADGLGEAYIMERVQGETLGRRIVRDDAFAEIRPGLARRCGEVLAIIHSAPAEGLPPLSTSQALDELERYEAIYRSAAAHLPAFELALRRLRTEAPRGAAPVLLHGDFRNGNLMIDPKTGLAAVLDWELAHKGDAASDLGWLCVNSWRFGGYQKPVGGFGDYQDLLDGYHDAGGARIDLEEVRYWQLFGSFKWGVMCLIMYSTFASGADPTVERAMIGRRVSETEIDLINLMEGRL